MPVRHATPADEPTIVKFTTRSLFDESLFGVTIHPRRHEFPEDVEIFWHETIREYFYKKDAIVLVSTTTEDEQGIPVGVAVWQRQGDDAGAQKVKDAWVDPGSNAFPPLPSTNNRALEPSKRNVLEDAGPYCEHLWSGDRQNNWYLALCAVDPAYQGKGFGKELVLWGLERALEENVHASVISSEGNEPFYLRCGFDEIVGNVTEGDGNPLHETAGGDLLFKWAKKE